MEPLDFDAADDAAASVRVYLDDDTQPLAVFRPPAQTQIDTTQLADGEHVLRLQALDESGVAGVRAIPFVVRNGPYITVSGLTPHEVVAGRLDVRVNAFNSSGEHFDPVAAESRRPAPNAVWIGLSVFLAWTLWYGLGTFFTPPAFAGGAGKNALAAANAPMNASDATRAGGANAGPGVKNVGGFDYATTGATLFAANCAGCHGAEGAGVPGAFPALAKDAVVNAADAATHIKTVLHGLHGKAIAGTTYASQMPAYPQLSDDDIAAIVDHERTSWGNAGPVITPAQVKQQR